MTPDILSTTFESPDGTPLVVHEAGTGAPLLLLHGYFSNARTNWIRYGHASKLIARGFRVLMPDLRGHGDSGKPHDPTAYPPDVLKDDGLALVQQLQLADGTYELAGYSLGARTAARMVIASARPRRLALAGMGLAGMLNTAGRGAFFREVLSRPGTFERGSAQWMAEAFLKTTQGDPVALLNILGTFVDSTREELASIAMPTLVICGAEDHDNGSAEALAALLPQGRYCEIPGNHMSAVARAELGQAMADFFAER